MLAPWRCMIPSRPRGKGFGASEALLEEKRRGGLLFPSVGGQCSGQMQDGLRWLEIAWAGAVGWGQGRWFTGSGSGAEQSWLAGSASGYSTVAMTRLAAWRVRSRAARHS